MMSSAIAMSNDIGVAHAAARLNACQAQLVNSCMVRIRHGIQCQETLSEISEQVRESQRQEKHKRKLSRNKELLALRFSFWPREESKKNSKKQIKDLDKMVFRKASHEQNDSKRLTA